jgi:hypothetical protein
MGEGRGAYRALVGRQRERNHLENLNADERIILKWNFQDVGWGGVDWLAQHRDKWRAHVNVVMNLHVP